MVKTTKIGPKGGNKCCHCCGKCTDANPIDGGSCPAHCCPCPPTGSLCVQFADPDGHGLCPNLMTTCFTMSPAVVTGSNPYVFTPAYAACTGSEGYGPEKYVGGATCYNPDVYTGCPGCGDPNRDYQKSISPWEFEKWAYEGTVCKTGTCDGENVNITLCCCDTAGAANQTAGFTDDCHGCRYQFRWEWGYQPGTSEYCTCPPLGYFDQHFIPPEDGIPGGGNILTWNVQDANCGSGDPEAFGGNEEWAITFNLTDVKWNCDCCSGGGDSDTTTPITVLAIVTPEPPGGCCV
jgi:hypothetical protein